MLMIFMSLKYLNKDNIIDYIQSRLKIFNQTGDANHYEYFYLAEFDDCRH
jgi:hypothetical protein